jgi:hypothetical protein
LVDPLVVVLVIKVDDLDFGLVDPQGDAPVTGDEQAPGAFAFAGQLIGFRDWHEPQFAFLPHVLKEGDDLADLWHDGRRQSRVVVPLDETP